MEGARTHTEGKQRLCCGETVKEREILSKDGFNNQSDMIENSKKKTFKNSFYETNYNEISVKS